MLVVFQLSFVAQTVALARTLAYNRDSGKAPAARREAQTEDHRRFDKHPQLGAPDRKPVKSYPYMGRGSATGQPSVRAKATPRIQGPRDVLLFVSLEAWFPHHTFSISESSEFYAARLRCPSKEPTVSGPWFFFETMWRNHRLQQLTLRLHCETEPLHLLRCQP